MSWNYNSDTGMISITKNDTATFVVNAMVREAGTDNLVPYIPEADDKIVFAIRKDKYDGDPLLEFIVDNETLTVTFEEGWGDKLPDGVGKYWYEISLNRGSYHETFVTAKVLKVTPEIYNGNNI